ncbi:hypothetical protein CVT24_002369 [Panaeolus cyanescens]|uniref:Fe2OG dioxygenase domain-containing protein n=1 Tax=Panaeolus cyanescens TaxID=181874 RepID=A0A409W128_9AGAR|nr:hypothetical protein CVT24_002369 [Panaeolus cyanescens]
MASTDFSEICKSLAESVQAEPPYISGSFAVGPNETKLFYQGTNGLGMLDFSKATDSDLEALSDACQPASFGVGGQDVLDASYRKAGKMDASNISSQFSPLAHGIVKLMREDLFKGQDAERGFRLELYKLNVYGPGSFFKAHVDTPRSENMFGSLVVILPTVHTGGSLIFRHGGKKWTFDSAAAIQVGDGTSFCRAAFTAFYSDVEHEVTPVVSGYRVSLTYNLYFTNGMGYKSQAAQIRARSSVTLGIEGHLKSLLSNPSFLPAGGYIGFRLIHRYPVHKRTDFSLLAKTLKGPDARILLACKSLGLPTSLQAFYSVPGNLFYYADPDNSEVVDEGGNRTYMFQSAIDSAHVNTEYDNMKDFLEGECKGQVVHDLTLLDATQKGSVEKKTKRQDIYWVNPEVKSATKVASSYIAYGNEASVEYVYGQVAIVVEVKDAEKRKTM